MLVEIDGTINGAERDRLQKELMVVRLDAARLRAALRATTDPVTELAAPDGALPPQVALQRMLLVNQVDEIRAKLGGLDRQIAQNEGNRDGRAQGHQLPAVTPGSVQAGKLARAVR